MTMILAEFLEFLYPRTAHSISAASNVGICINDIIGQAEVARGKVKVVFP